MRMSSDLICLNRTRERKRKRVVRLSKYLVGFERQVCFVVLVMWKFPSNPWLCTSYLGSDTYSWCWPWTPPPSLCLCFLEPGSPSHRESRLSLWFPNRTLIPKYIGVTLQAFHKQEIWGSPTPKGEIGGTTTLCRAAKTEVWVVMTC